MSTSRNILFIINQEAGASNTDYESSIEEFFRNNDKDVKLHFHNLAWSSTRSFVLHYCWDNHIDTIVAVGGDGTVNYVANAVYGMDISFGVIPAGSANAVAYNLKIPNNLNDALNIIMQNNTEKIRSMKVNNHFCFHIADVGFNAEVIKRFEDIENRGWKGYFKAGAYVLFDLAKFKCDITIDDDTLIVENAVMVVFTNMPAYGTGLVINPIAKMNDDFFEIILIKKISILEIIKMMRSRWTPHTDKTQIIQCKKAVINTQSFVHLQVDGEYLGKVKEVSIEINKTPTRVIVGKL